VLFLLFILLYRVFKNDGSKIGVVGDAKISGKCQGTKVLNPTVFELEALKG